MNDPAAIIAAVRSLARGEQPSIDISETLYHHRCFYWLSTFCSPTTYTQKAREARTMHRISLHQRYRTCAPLFDTLAREKIPYAVIKGAPLSLAAYGNEDTRFSSDVDILVARAEIDTLGICMRELGFAHGRITPQGTHPLSRREQLFYATMTHQIAPYIKETGNPLCPYINVDINTDLLWGESNHKLDSSHMLCHTETAAVCSTAVRILTREAAFIQLCLHHYKDMNSLYLLTVGKLRLSLFCDIYYFLRHSPPDCKRLAALCEEWGVTPYVAYCLHYTQTIFKDDRLIRYQDAIGTEGLEPLLNTYGLNDSERKKWNIPFPDRLFLEDLGAHIRAQLSETELAKLRINQDYL